MEVYLRPKNIIVVGGASGIGLATAQRLLDGKAENIILASRNQQKLDSACKSLKKEDWQKISSFPFDISEVQSHSLMIEKAEKIIGKSQLDGLVISSGVNFDGSNWKGFNICESDWDKVMDTNLKGPFFLLRTFANYLHSNNRKGNICVVSSISAHRDSLSAYQVSKKALSQIVFTFGKYLCERGVVLNCVEPGVVDTDMMPHLRQYTDGIREGKPWNDSSIKRVIRPEEIAEVIYILMSNLGEIMSGSCVLCGGGTKALFP
ncbi:MAG: SDR family oxidoreductase [Clostridia bacterium]|nr:SDR family oxidoreductase [Clostridia bacterium]